MRMGKNKNVASKHKASDYNERGQTLHPRMPENEENVQNFLSEHKTEGIKRKRKPKNHKNNSMKKANIEVTQPKYETSSQQNALNYLKSWKEDRSNWKFEKSKQIRLLKNPFDLTKIPDSDFLTFAEYMGAARGGARDALERRAAGIVEAVEKRQELLAGGAEEVQVERDHPELKVDMKSYERARTLLQCFQEV